MLLGSNRCAGTKVVYRFCLGHETSRGIYASAMRQCSWGEGGSPLPPQLSSRIKAAPSIFEGGALKMGTTATIRQYSHSAHLHN